MDKEAIRKKITALLEDDSLGAVGKKYNTDYHVELKRIHWELLEEDIPMLLEEIESLQKQLQGIGVEQYYALQAKCREQDNEIGNLRTERNEWRRRAKEVAQERDEARLKLNDAEDYGGEMRHVNAALLNCVRHYASNGSWLHDIHGYERIYCGTEGPSLAVETLAQCDTSQPTAQGEERE